MYLLLSLIHSCQVIFTVKMQKLFNVYFQHLLFAGRKNYNVAILSGLLCKIIRKALNNLITVVLLFRILEIVLEDISI